MPAPRPRWRSRVVVAAAAVIVAVALALLRPWEGHDGDGATGTPTTNRTIPDDDSGAVQYDGPVSFQVGTDLDQVPPPNNTTGGTWGVDIWFYVPTRLETGPGAAIVSWEGKSAPTRADCVNRLTGAVEEKPVIVKEGDRVCVRTSGNWVACVTFTGQSADDWYTFDATVWES